MGYVATRRERASLRGTATVTLDVPSADIDLESWLFGLSDQDYQACARGHHGAGVFTTSTAEAW